MPRPNYVFDFIHINFGELDFDLSQLSPVLGIAFYQDHTQKYPRELVVERIENGLVSEFYHNSPDYCILIHFYWIMMTNGTLHSFY